MIFKKVILSLLILITSIWCAEVYSAEYVDLGYRDGFVIEASVNVASFVYVVGEYSGDAYSYGAGVGYRGNAYSSIVTVSQVVADTEYYKGEAQLNFNDGKFSTFAVISFSEKGTGYRIGAGYPLNEKTSITSYISDKGMFFGFRRKM